MSSSDDDEPELFEMTDPVASLIIQTNGEVARALSDGMTFSGRFSSTKKKPETCSNSFLMLPTKRYKMTY